MKRAILSIVFLFLAVTVTSAEETSVSISETIAAYAWLNKVEFDPHQPVTVWNEDVLKLTIHAITDFQVGVRILEGDAESITLSATASGREGTINIINPGLVEDTFWITEATTGKNNADGVGETIEITFEMQSDQEAQVELLLLEI